MSCLSDPNNIGLARCTEGSDQHWCFQPRPLLPHARLASPVQDALHCRHPTAAAYTVTTTQTCQSWLDTSAAWLLMTQSCTQGWPWRSATVKFSAPCHSAVRPRGAQTATLRLSKTYHPQHAMNQEAWMLFNRLENHIQVCNTSVCRASSTPQHHAAPLQLYSADRRRRTTRCFSSRQSPGP